LKPISRTVLAATPILAALAFTLPLGADAQVKESRRVTSNVTATCKSWVASGTALVVCEDIAYENLPVGTCLSRQCSSSAGGVAKFADGRYEGAFDGAFPGKGNGRLVRNDGSVVEGNFRSGEMWKVTAYFPNGVMWQGTVASELKQNAFGTWSVYRDQGGTRHTGVIRYGSLFARPDAGAVALGRARLDKVPGTAEAPREPGTDLTPIVLRSRGLTASTSSEHATCWGLYIVMAEKIEHYGRMGLPETFSPAAVASRAKAWDKMTRASYKRSGSGGIDKARDDAVTKFRKAYDLGQLDQIAEWAGICVTDPKPS